LTVIGLRKESDEISLLLFLDGFVVRLPQYLEVHKSGAYANRYLPPMAVSSADRCRNGVSTAARTRAMPAWFFKAIPSKMAVSSQKTTRASRHELTNT
jgi:hypothetical protein